MRCSLTNTLADLTFFLPIPYSPQNLSFHFGSLSTCETNLVLLAMMTAVPLDCAEIPLLVVFTVFPFYVIPYTSSLHEAPINISNKQSMLLEFFVFSVMLTFLCPHHKVIVNGSHQRICVMTCVRFFSAASLTTRTCRICC